MRNISFSCLVTFLLLSTCQSEQTSEKESASGPSVYSIDVNAKSVDFLDQIESISVFGFEETEESLLKPSSFFFEYEKGVVVVNESAGDVFVFDRAGSFVSKFNRKGGGPEEYGSMQNTVYRKGFIETYDMAKQRLLRYDLDGKFLSELKLPVRAAHIFYHTGRYLMSRGNKKTSDSLNYNLVFMDEVGKELGRAMPIELAVPFPIATSINEFSIADDKPVFNALLTDSVVVIDDLQLKQHIRFDFSDDWFWTEEMYANGSKAMSVLGNEDEEGKAWVYTWVLGPKRIEFGYNTSFRDSRSGFINRSSGEFLHYDYPSWGEEIPSIRNVRFEGDELVMVILPDVLDVFIENLGEDNYMIDSGQAMEDLLQSENPVIVKARFKPLDN